MQENMLECPECGNSSLSSVNAIELGHAFYLGTHYTSIFNAKYMPADDPSSLMPIHMGCYGIGISRLIAAIARASYDNTGLVWPDSVAPWNCIILEGTPGSGESVYVGIASVIGADNVLLDDRPHVSAGWKLHDAKKIGYPHIIVLGRVWEETGRIEVIHRKSGETEYVESSAVMDPGFWGR